MAIFDSNSQRIQIRSESESEFEFEFGFESGIEFDSKLEIESQVSKLELCKSSGGTFPYSPARIELI